MMPNDTVLQLIVGVVLFSLIMMALVFIVLLARARLLSTGFARVTVNQSQSFSVPLGKKLLFALAEQGVFLPAACGGKGACGQCLVKVIEGNDSLLPVETAHITSRQAAQGMRLACALRLKNDTTVQIPEALLVKQQRECKVVSNQLVSTFITQIELAPVDAPALEFEAGDYLLLQAPPCSIKFEDFNIAAEYLPEWQRFNLLSLQTEIEETELRAYSLANAPSENTTIRLLVRIATPPAKAPVGTPAGKVSSYIFGLKPDERVFITGPFGNFHVQQNENEMLFIGGGAGMAPLRAMIREQLLWVKTRRKISFWYGARSKQQLCYQREFEELMEEHENFSWHVALSEPLASDNWTGHVGFIHAVALQHYLSRHPSPQSIDYYICGPAVMSAAVTTMLKSLGVKTDSIFIDDFGGS